MKRTLIIAALLLAGAAQANEIPAASRNPESYPAVQETKRGEGKTREQVKAELAAARMRLGTQNPEAYPAPSEFISLRVG